MNHRSQCNPQYQYDIINIYLKWNYFKPDSQTTLKLLYPELVMQTAKVIFKYRSLIFTYVWQF